MLSFAAKTCYNRSCFRGNLPGRFSYASTVERKLHCLCRLSLSPFSLLCSSPARESNTSVARATTSRPCAATASMSITPARPATIISICSANSRFPLDFEQIIGYTKSVIPHAGVVELADTRDLKSLDSDIVPVQVRLAAPKKVRILYLYLFYFLRIISTKTLQVTICTKEF